MLNRLLVIAALLLAALAVPGAAHAANPAVTTTVTVAGHGECDFTKPAERSRAKLACEDGFTKRLRPCRQEDSRNCHWLADRRGNGQGNSFINLRGRVFYLR